MIPQNLQNSIQKLAQSIGLLIYDIEFVREGGEYIFRIYLTNFTPNKSPLKITLEHCQRLSELVSPLLDVEFNSDKSYHLEVSSCGIYRSLKTPEHFALSLGEMLKITLKDNTKIKGILTSCDENIITIENKQIHFDDIKKARTTGDFDA
ncbi:MAG: ribosome maturation factor [Helicobacter sp.]|nr:ribosome maturation factor [Helicobacter sp.]